MKDERQRRRPATDASLDASGDHDRATHRATLEDGDTSLPGLIRELADDGAELVRQEVALVRAEMREKLNTFTSAAGTMAAGGALLLAALLTLLWAVNRGMTALLAQFVAVDVAIWLSPLILTVLLGAIGWSMVQGGRRTMKNEGITPHQTKASLEENTSWARSRAREMKAEVKHG